VRTVATRIIAMIFLACACYFAWASYRWDLWDIAHDRSWPHALPYPYQWLMAREHSWDLAKPAAPGTIKMTGEFARVRNETRLATVLCATAGAFCSLPTVLQLVRRFSSKRRGFQMS
jgi:hypothetical protein